MLILDDFSVCAKLRTLSDRGIGHQLSAWHLHPLSAGLIRNMRRTRVTQTADAKTGQRTSERY